MSRSRLMNAAFAVLILAAVGAIGFLGVKAYQLQNTIADLKEEAVTLGIEKASKELDLAMSKLNAGKMAREKDALIQTILADNLNQSRRADQLAEDLKEIASAPSTNACAQSPAMRGALARLRSRAPRQALRGAERSLPAASRPGRDVDVRTVPVPSPARRG